MKRTRKWSFVGQEATRLAALGLTPLEIAHKIGLAKSTVTRWAKAGKLVIRAAKGGERDADRAEVAASGAKQSPSDWSASVRATYALDSTDDQLVTMAESVLRDALDETKGLTLRLAAMGRFQSLVKQLALVARAEPQSKPAAPETEPKRPALQVVRKPRTDPRAALAAAK
jgi:hypothetical protein